MRTPAAILEDNDDDDVDDDPRSTLSEDCVAASTLTGTNAAALAWPQQDNARSETNASSMCPSCLASQWMPWSRLCSGNIINIAIPLPRIQRPHETGLVW
ncbi:hypothetical protein ACLKA6_005496 [Drosophila palustris]